MNSQFSVKDYLNYTMSGVLWMIVFGYILLTTDIIDKHDVCDISQITNSTLFGFVIIFFGGYTLGNLLRFMEGIIEWLNNFLFGDPYYNALYSDKKLMEKDHKLGWIGNRFKSKRLSINEKDSEKIEKKLISIGILKDNKKTQYLLLESYLKNKINNNKVDRMNDLKNFYDSISAPFFILFSVLLFEIFKSNLTCYLKLLLSLVALFILYKFIDRYRFLFSNFIKETYRCFLFI